MKLSDRQRKFECKIYFCLCSIKLIIMYIMSLRVHYVTEGTLCYRTKGERIVFDEIVERRVHYVKGRQAICDKAGTDYHATG